MPWPSFKVNVELTAVDKSIDNATMRKNAATWQPKSQKADG
jgi:hypothetical protein